MSRCGYCGGPLDQIDISSFGEGVIHTIDGRCENRCTPPRCITCDHDLDTDRSCQNLDCPLVFVTQFELAKT